MFIPCDIIVVSIGQGIDSKHFEDKGIQVKKGSIAGMDNGMVEEDGIFAGGDYVTDLANVIRTIAAGRVVAPNLDDYLGFRQEITCDIDIPYVTFDDKAP